MANNLGSLVVSLGLDAAEFTRGLSKSEYQTQQWVRRFETGIEAARTGALSAFAAMGTAAVVLDRQLNSIAGFQDVADKVGDTAQEVASLKLALDLSGTSADAAAAASVRLTSALAKTDDESKGVGLALNAIGLEFDEFKRLAPVAQLDAVAQALARFEDGAGKTAVAVQLFGRSGAELIPLFNDLAETGGRQVTLTQQQIEAADEYSKSTARLRSEVQTLVSVTAADAAPVLTQMVQILRDINTFATASSGGFNLLAATLEGAKLVLQTIVVLGSDVAFVFRQTGVEIGGMAAQLAALMRLDFSGFNAISQAMKEDAARARAELDAFQARVLGSGLVAGGAAASYSNEGRNYTARPQAIRFTPPVVSTRTGGTARAGISEAERAQQEYDAFQREAATALDRYLQNRHTQRLREEEAAEKRYLQDLADYEQAQSDYVYQRNLKRWEDEERQQLESARRVQEAQEESARRVGDAFSNTFNEMFQRGADFGDLLKKLAFDIINIKVLTPAAQNIGNTAANFVSSLFSFDGGGYTGAGPRTGGLDGRGGFMAMLHPNETVLDHTRGQSAGGGGVTIAQTFNFGNADAATVGQLRAEAARIKAETLAAVPAAMVQAVRTSTGVARAMRGA
jgi:hypothetical protein